jgi:hypothetical protein
MKPLERSMPPNPKAEIVADPQEAQRVVLAQPVNPVQYERDMQARERAARRRDPEARNNAQATLDAAPKIIVILNPTEEDRQYGERNKDRDGNPRYPAWTCTYNGLVLAYPVGEPVEMPVYIYEQYQHNMRLPVFRKQPGDPGQVFSREIPDNGALYEPPDMGR